jgi:hypothetical protein
MPFHVRKTNIVSHNPINNKLACICDSAATRLDPISLWTSGANEGEHCDVELYSWCSNGTQGKKQELLLPWADSNPREFNENCISLNLMRDEKFALDYAECKTEKQIICEV